MRSLVNIGAHTDAHARKRGASHVVSYATETVGFLWEPFRFSMIFLLDSYDVSMGFLWNAYRNSMI